MRPGRAIRTLLAFALSGAFVTVASSWAVYAVQTSRLHRQPTTLWPLYVLRDEQAPTALAMREPGVSAWRHYRLVPGAIDVRGWERPSIDRPSRLEAAGFRIDLQGMVAHSSDAEPNMRSREVLSITDSDWPWLAMRQGTYVGGYLGPSGHPIELRTSRQSLFGGLQATAWQPQGPWMTGAQSGHHNPLDRIALPLLPIWPGFLLNMVCYGLLVFALWRGFGEARGVLRRRRGLCFAFGYRRAGLGHADSCPECGARHPSGSRRWEQGSPNPRPRVR